MKKEQKSNDAAILVVNFRDKENQTLAKKLRTNLNVIKDAMDEILGLDEKHDGQIAISDHIITKDPDVNYKSNACHIICKGYDVEAMESKEFVHGVFNVLQDLTGNGLGLFGFDEQLQLLSREEILKRFEDAAKLPITTTPIQTKQVMHDNVSLNDGLMRESENNVQKGHDGLG